MPCAASIPASKPGRPRFVQSNALSHMGLERDEDKSPDTFAHWRLAGGRYVRRRKIRCLGGAEPRQPMAPEVLHHAKRAVIDWYAALLPGAVVAPATLLEKALAEELDRGGARLALGRKATVRAAAFINGTAAHTHGGGRHLPRRHLPSGRADHRGRARARPGARRVRRGLPARGDHRLRNLDAHRRGHGARALQVLAQHRHHRQLRRGGGGAPRSAARTRSASRTRSRRSRPSPPGLQQSFRMDSMSKPQHAGHAAEAGVHRGARRARGRHRRRST